MQKPCEIVKLLNSFFKVYWCLEFNEGDFYLGDSPHDNNNQKNKNNCNNSSNNNTNDNDNGNNNNNSNWYLIYIDLILFYVFCGLV